MAERKVVGFNYAGRPVFELTDEELAKPAPHTEEFDCVEALPDGRLITETGYDDATKTYSYHEVDDRGNIRWDKPIDQEDVPADG